MIIEKRYRSAFVVEESKVTRLLGVIKESIPQEGLLYEESLDAYLSGAKTVEAKTVQEIMALDNSERSKVKRLVIRCEAKPNVKDDAAHFVRVDFDGELLGDVAITVVSDEGRIASNVVSVAEEQIERMLDRGLIQRLLTNREVRLAVPLMLAGMITVAMLTVPARVASRLSKTMWLAPSDLADIEPMIRGTKAIVPDQATDILTRQLRNVIAQQSASPFSSLADWRVIVLLVPVMILLGAFVTLSFCYPRAVFLWGDAAEKSRRLLARRRWIWNVVVATLVLGLIANMAVFALGSLITGRSV